MAVASLDPIHTKLNTAVLFLSHTGSFSMSRARMDRVICSIIEYEWCGVILPDLEYLAEGLYIRSMV